MHSPKPKSLKQMFIGYFAIALGSLLGAIAIHIFLYPNNLIDGGVVGIAMMLGRLTSEKWFPLYLIIINLPFIYLAYTHIRRTFVIQMGFAVAVFAFFLWLLDIYATPFIGDPLEIIFFGGALLGFGAGLIIRYGACTDGAEILGIIINRRTGFTVGQVILVINFFIFAAYGWIFLDWHIALKSFMTYIVAFKVIDLVIVGLDELKSVTIISQKSKQVSKRITDEMGLGLTVMYGRGGYTGDEREILLVVVERLDLSELKDLVLSEDPSAFVAIQDLHEIVSGRTPKKIKRKKRKDPRTLKS
jgi:uncharacterized membrane-anchored protein YitT (DUF2179 family)